MPKFNWENCCFDRLLLNGLASQIQNFRTNKQRVLFLWTGIAVFLAHPLCGNHTPWPWSEKMNKWIEKSWVGQMAFSSWLAGPGKVAKHASGTWRHGLVKLSNTPYCLMLEARIPQKTLLGGIKKVLASPDDLCQYWS